MIIVYWVVRSDHPWFSVLVSSLRFRCVPHVLPVLGCIGHLLLFCWYWAHRRCDFFVSLTCFLFLDASAICCCFVGTGLIVGAISLCPSRASCFWMHRPFVVVLLV